MCAVHDANNRPCTTNTLVTAIRGQRCVRALDEADSTGAMASTGVTVDRPA
jgi:hypothetical protein